jgi:RecA-family ATPase
MNSLLPVTKAADLMDQEAATQRWLIEELWADQAVGIIGGEPKCCKSFLALDIAVSVASGRPCLRHFAVGNPGRVLLYAAEDSLSIVRRRLEGIAYAAKTELSDLDIQVITSPVMRLDREEDAARLRRTIEKLRPRLLILDPFVRLHRIDENNSGEVAPILANLREMQRTYGVAIMLVHHAKKGGANDRAGQALRGSSEFHAWGDSNLYLRRNKAELLTLTIEQRAGVSRGGIALELKSEGVSLGLQLSDRVEAALIAQAPKLILADRIVATLQSETAPLSLRRLRERCQSRTSSVATTLDQLVAAGQVTQTASGYSLL